MLKGIINHFYDLLLVINFKQNGIKRQNHFKFFIKLSYKVVISYAGLHRGTVVGTVD